jgi:Tfp pilus assembly protein PilO
MAAKRRERHLVIAALVCLGLLAGRSLVLGPIHEGWKARSVRIAELDGLVERGELLMDQSDAIGRRWAAMHERSLPADTSEAENKVIGAVGRWAADSRLTVTDRKPRWQLGEEEGGRLEVRVSGNGDMRAIARFLYELERDPLALRLEDVSVRARDDRGAELALEARFTGLIMPEATP